jgi:hypothetical protein
VRGKCLITIVWVNQGQNPCYVVCISFEGSIHEHDTIEPYIFTFDLFASDGLRISKVDSEKMILNVINENDGF